ncbi:THAP domain-containing protein 8-like isoform X1 [Sinocyclocheilus grahami]|uniref:THAP domain-containing protein 8-like isoform X1 n=1 Tax=Sinocyclocheilus grahami TaxID=75366 RepID=UPI0007ACBA98|nr:PREDICTED: THAP domain-containing protein 8-like isoform X1 [Sinocyclocheilus grahami]
MAKRCVFGCLPNKTLFSIPRPPWLRSRWLEFLHFEEEGLTVNSRLCSRHFTPECFQNLTQHQMGFARVLYLKNTAVPSVYTVGASQSMKPRTRDVGCQCSAQTPKKSTSVQASFPTPKPKRRSKAVQVKSSEHADLVCAHLETPERAATPIKAWMISPMNQKPQKTVKGD